MLKLDPTQPGFTWSNARACAERCALAYVAQTSGLCAGQSLVTNAATDTEALVINEGNCISIAFRGSQNLRDWLQDFKARPEHPREKLIAYDGRAAEIHQGFLEDVDSITVDLIRALRELADGRSKMADGAASPSPNSELRTPIFVTGHSKGGGEAIDFAIELDRQRFPIAGVYTFGQPRVGNRAFANLYNETLYEETFRVVNQNDVVPRVPGVLMGYKHCGQEIFLPVGGGWSLNPPLWTVLLSDALGLWGAYRHETDVLVSDHNIAAYQRRIQIL